MYGARLFLLTWLLRLPCLPAQLAAPAPAAGPGSSAAAPLPAPPPRPWPPAPSRPPPLAMEERARYRVDYGVLAVGQVVLSIDGSDGAQGAAGGILVRAGGHGE